MPPPAPAPRLRALAAAALLLAACAVPLTRAEINQRLQLAGASALGPSARFTAIPIEAETAMEAWTLTLEARTGGPSDEARSLQRKLQDGARRRQALVVGGPYSTLTQQVLLDALSLNGSRPLTGLTLVVVAEPDAAREVGAAAQSLGVRFLHRDIR